MMHLTSAASALHVVIDNPASPRIDRVEHAAVMIQIPRFKVRQCRLGLKIECCVVKLDCCWTLTIPTGLCYA